MSMEERRQKAQNVLNELLTGVSPDVKEAILAMQDVLMLEIEMLRAQLSVRS
jgi:hypothetical protein